jgi:hypothetical protein
LPERSGPNIQKRARLYRHPQQKERHDMGSIGYIKNGATEATRAHQKDTKDVRDMTATETVTADQISPYVNLQNNLRFTTEGVIPPCAHTCGCISLRTAQLTQQISWELERHLMAIRMLCEERSLEQNTKNINEVLSEIHDRWLATLEGAEAGRYIVDTSGGEPAVGWTKTSH